LAKPSPSTAMLSFVPGGPDFRICVTLSGIGLAPWS
jgi:hypothetical protein